MLFTKVWQRNVHFIHHKFAIVNEKNITFSERDTGGILRCFHVLHKENDFLSLKLPNGFERQLYWFTEVK